MLFLDTSFNLLKNRVFQLSGKIKIKATDVWMCWTARNFLSTSTLSADVVCLFVCLFVYFWHDSLQLVRTSSFTRFLDHTQRRTTVGRTPLDEWSARRRDLYLTTHNTHNRKTSMLPVGFEPTISAGEMPQTYALVRAATGTGRCSLYLMLLPYQVNSAYEISEL